MRKIEKCKDFQDANAYFEKLNKLVDAVNTINEKIKFLDVAEMTGKVRTVVWGEQTQEPECGEHREEKPAKKECDKHPSGECCAVCCGTKLGKKDELAERLIKVFGDANVSVWHEAFPLVANEARKWTVEQAEKCEVIVGCDYWIKKEDLLERLKGGRK